jgi:hypothetical protein
MGRGGGVAGSPGGLAGRRKRRERRPKAACHAHRHPTGPGAARRRPAQVSACDEMHPCGRKRCGCLFVLLSPVLDAFFVLLSPVLTAACWPLLMQAYPGV